MHVSGALTNRSPFGRDRDVPLRPEDYHVDLPPRHSDEDRVSRWPLRLKLDRLAGSMRRQVILYQPPGDISLLEIPSAYGRAYHRTLRRAVRPRDPLTATPALCKRTFRPNHRPRTSPPARDIGVDRPGFKFGSVALLPETADHTRLVLSGRPLNNGRPGRLGAFLSSYRL